MRIPWVLVCIFYGSKVCGDTRRPYAPVPMPPMGRPPTVGPNGMATALGASNRTQSPMGVNYFPRPW